MTQLDPVLMHLLRRREVIPPETLRDIAQQIGIGMTRASQLALWAGLAGILCALIGLVIGLARLSAGSIVLGGFLKRILPFCGVWVGPFGFWMATRQVRTRRTTRVMLEHPRCPHCGYDLRGLPTAPEDGATVCPECGCAWRLGAAQWH